MWALTWGNSHYNLQPALTQWPVESRRELRLVPTAMVPRSGFASKLFAARAIFRLRQTKMTFSGWFFNEFFRALGGISRILDARRGAREKLVSKILPQTSARARAWFI